MRDSILERVKGIEPSYEAWEAAVLPLNYTRSDADFTRSATCAGTTFATLPVPDPTPAPPDDVPDRGLRPLAAGLVLASLAAALGGDTAAAWLKFDRDAVLAGQAWRLLSAHVVHLGWMHTLMNGAALVLVAVALGSAFSTRAWAALALVSALGVGLGLLAFSPQVAWYVGLSGVVHGLVAGGGVARTRARLSVGWPWLAALAAKLAWEQWQGPLASNEALLGGTTVVDAHLWGAVAGAAAAAMLPARRDRSEAHQQRQ